ncbi:hypothetical protein [Streptomyces sp. NPDC004296]|uniref:hypothetical protein n=1 Tax=Streptomyces sp. NPDC004296 TaxID=3364697 RepID=UPI0036C86BD0
MTLFLNGPVQNGPFTLAERPGKAAGIRLAEALNQLTGTQPAPHLWNTVTLDGDVRHRAVAGHQALSRGQWERRQLTAKYAPSPPPAAGLLTDTAPPVAALALAVCQELPANGTLALAPVTVRLCRACDHMTGEVEVDHGCRACTAGAGTRTATRRLLVHDRPGCRPVLERADFHATRASTPASARPHRAGHAAGVHGPPVGHRRVAAEGPDSRVGRDGARAMSAGHRASPPPSRSSCRLARRHAPGVKVQVAGLCRGRASPVGRSGKPS